VLALLFALASGVPQAHVRAADAVPGASDDGRRRVRGDRGERASIHAAWTPPAFDPDRADRDALAAFESEVLAPTQTIVSSAPEPWMKALTMPDLPVRWNRGLVEYLRYFTKDPRGIAMMWAWLCCAGRYEAMVERILVQHDVPVGLVWVVMAESGFHPRVRSAAGAAGPWQFMEGTGGVYGLSKSYWIDWRFDIERSTVAAANYLQDLRVRFGSWELALAAYNAGYGLVTTSIERHNTNNFWALAELESGLPHATVNYVPKIVAAAIIARNRDALGFGSADISPLPPVEWVDVEVAKSTPLAELARIGGVDVDLVAELNAHLVRGRTPPGVVTKVRMPRAAATRIGKARPELEAQWTGEAVHVAREGERLAAIAARHGISEKELRGRNGIRDAAEIGAGVALVVPAGARTADGQGDPRPLAAVPPMTLGKAERLVFFEATRATTTASIARAFGTTWEHVVAWNDLDPHARLQPGQLLQLAVASEFDAAAKGVVVHELGAVHRVVRGSREHIEASLALRGKSRRAIKARRGDTLASIGRRVDLTDGDLARINGYPRDHALETGELVIVYVDEARRKGTLEAPSPRRPSTADAAASIVRHDGDAPASASTPATTAPPKPGTKPTTKPAGGAPKATRRAPSTPASSRLPGQGRGAPP